MARFLGKGTTLFFLYLYLINILVSFLLLIVTIYVAGIWRIAQNLDLSA